MFLKYLLITNNEGLIRKIDFRMGVNLIIDETLHGTSATGNNVGKTTILRLIEFCLGGDQRKIYSTRENGENKLVKDFLKETETEVELCLTDSLVMPESRDVIIRRDFKEGRKGEERLRLVCSSVERMERSGRRFPVCPVRRESACPSLRACTLL